MRFRVWEDGHPSKVHDWDVKTLEELAEKIEKYKFGKILNDYVIIVCDGMLKEKE